jgi:hypothetical protein
MPIGPLAMPSPAPDLEQALQSAEASLLALRQRYDQVVADRQRQAELEQQQAVIEADPDLPQDFQKISTELQEIEFRLESELFSWDSWKMYFWQTVRFTGLGLVIGWLAAFYVIQHPVPRTEPVAPQSEKIAP